MSNTIEQVLRNAQTHRFQRLLRDILLGALVAVLIISAFALGQYLEPIVL